MAGGLNLSRTRGSSLPKGISSAEDARSCAWTSECILLACRKPQNRRKDELNGLRITFAFLLAFSDHKYMAVFSSSPIAPIGQCNKPCNGPLSRRSVFRSKRKVLTRVLPTIPRSIKSPIKYRNLEENDMKPGQAPWCSCISGAGRFPHR